MSSDLADAAPMIMAPAQPTAKAPADRFTGDVWVDPITNGAEAGCARLATVRFSPGARSGWHCHARGQTLNVTHGVGLVQSASGQTIVMRPGDTVYTPPGVWHWHGAIPDSFMTHIALADSTSEPGSADVEWGQHVTDEEYIAAVEGSSVTTDEGARTLRDTRPLIIAAQGSFAVGGTVTAREGRFDPRQPTDPAGQTMHTDHARVSYQIPTDARQLPLLFWHGWWEDSTCWDTTPDGREGFRTLFLRSGYPVYLLDQPRRGSAGKTAASPPATPEPNEQWFFNQFRLGEWPELYPGVQFSDDPAALEQFFRGMVPDTGPIESDVLVAGASAALNRIGPSVLVTHSHAGGFGWLVQMANENVRAVISIEPGSGFVFPDTELPDAMPSSNGTLEPVAVTVEHFRALTRVPIVVYYGDNIPNEPTDIAGRDNWRVRQMMARLWVDTVNRHGGDATFVSLPDRGIHGNTHFAFSDLNNQEIADEITAFLADKNLD